MKQLKEELQKVIDDQLKIQKIAIDKDFKNLEEAYKEFLTIADKQESSNQLLSRIQGVRRDLLMTKESIQHVTRLIDK